MGRRAVQVEVILLDVLAVIPLAVGQPEQPLLEDRIIAIPERQRKTEHLVVITDSAKAVFAPAVGA